MNEEEKKLFRLYGKLPNKKDILQKKLEVGFQPSLFFIFVFANSGQERKYFDSGDYALSKAGKASEGGVTNIGSEHPLPENIPHLTSPSLNGTHNGAGTGNGLHLPGGHSGSPVKESSSFLYRQTSVVDQEEPPKQTFSLPSGNSPPAKNTVPIRWQH